jgi:uncharacterized protein (DUF1778 family)
MANKHIQKQNDLAQVKEETLVLNAEATQRFYELLKNPPEPNEHLKAAYKDYQNSKLNYGQ